MEGEADRNRKYQKINLRQRSYLIHRVCQEKKTIVQAAGEVGIHPSTARMIILKYRQKGTMFEKKEDRMRRELEEKVMEETKAKELLDQQANLHQNAPYMAPNGQILDGYGWEGMNPHFPYPMNSNWNVFLYIP